MRVHVSRQKFLNSMNFIKFLGNRLFLRPFANKSIHQLFFYYLTLFLVVLICTQLFVTLYFNGLSDWLEFVNIAPNIGACFISSIKYTMINNNKDFYDMTFKHFYNNMWDLISDETSEKFKIFTKYTNMVNVLIKLTLFFAILVTIVVDSFPWLLMTYESQIIGKNSSYLYPIDVWYPFDKENWFSIVYIWESFVTAIVIILYDFTNVVHVSYISYTCMELSILGNCMQNLFSELDKKNITNGKYLSETHEKVNSNLKTIIKRYEFLSRLCTRLDEVLGSAMFLAYVFDTIFICLTAFTFSVVDDFYLSVRYFSFFLALLFEIFVQCIIGQVLMDHSVALTEKIYFSDWIYADPKTKKNLLMMLMRTQKPFKLSAKGFVIMNLNTFTQSVALTEKIYFSDWIYADPKTKKNLLMMLMRTQKPFKLSAKGFVIMNLHTFTQICSSSFSFFNLLLTFYNE